MKIVLGLGTNIGTREQNLKDALAAIALLPQTTIIKKSPVYETKPYGYADQSDFLNLAVLVETDLPPESMLGACLGIEAALGRVRLFKNGPRIIDIDVLLAEKYCSDTPLLRVPHPEIRNRSFVLQPLMDLFPQGEVFGYDFSAAFGAHPMNDIQPFNSADFYI